MSSTPPLRACPKQNPTTYGTWYQLSAIASLHICSHCFDVNIAKTALATRFSAESGVSMEAGYTCDFYTPRVQILWQQCLAQGTTDAILQYAAQCRDIPRCAGSRAPPRDVYVLRNPAELAPAGTGDYFALCQACHEGYAVPAGITHRFVLASGNPRRLTCDLTTSFMCEAFKLQNDSQWPVLIGTLRARMNAAQCFGAHVTVRDNRRCWTVSSATGLAVCDACYQDHVLFSPFRMRFTQTTYTAEWTCDFAVVAVVYAFLASAQITRFDLFTAAATASLSQPSCNTAGVADDWYVMRGSKGCAPFELCAVCFACYVVPGGFTNNFVRTRYPAKQLHTCKFQQDSSRFLELLERFEQAVDTSDWPYFATFASQVASTPPPPTYATRTYTPQTPPVPPCPRDTRVNGHRFWGTSQWAACEACYDTIIRGSALEPLLTVRGQTVSDRWCELYSPRMRVLAAAGNLPALERAADERRKVYGQIQAAKGDQVRAAKLRMNMARNGLRMMGDDGRVELAGRPGPYVYGNDVLGYGYATPGGVEGAMMVRNALDASGETAASAAIASLTTQWRAVE